MVTTGKSLPQRISRWRLLIDNFREEVADEPRLAEELLELQRMLDQSTVLQAEIADLRSQSQAATARLRKLATQGDRLRSRIGATLRGRHGFTSQILLRFGFKPRPTSRRAGSENSTPV